jgi:hypothetical protein
MGPPRDVDAAIALLREAVASGVNHIDTADFYGPHVTNQLIRKALSPYPDDLVIVTKVSARRGEDGSWIPAFSPEELTPAIHDNLRNLRTRAQGEFNATRERFGKQAGCRPRWFVGDLFGSRCRLASSRDSFKMTKKR